jgi:histidinol-phosphate aminotransferase
MRGDLVAMSGYHSPQVAADVRLNTNESPFPPPEGFMEELGRQVARLELHRYPDREARALREGLAELHGVGVEEIFCANGSNEVLQSLLLAYGGAGRRAAVFEPTYALHSHISRVTGTEVVTGWRDDDFAVDWTEAAALMSEQDPAVLFLCSPNNPTGRLEARGLVTAMVAEAPGLVVVDEAYGQFAPWSALSLRAERAPGAESLVVARTFSKTWAMAAMRLGYLVADPEVVAACEVTVLPYHLSTVTQLAGVLALSYREEMERRVALVAKCRGELSAGLAGLDVESWPSDANFVLFRPRSKPAPVVWAELVDQGVLVRDCSGWPGLTGCLRVTVGTEGENGRFLEALTKVLG